MRLMRLSDQAWENQHRLYHMLLCDGVWEREASWPNEDEGTGTAFYLSQINVKRCKSVDKWQTQTYRSCFQTLEYMYVVLYI